LSGIEIWPPRRNGALQYQPEESRAGRAIERLSPMNFSQAAAPARSRKRHNHRRICGDTPGKPCR
jgi:hypothetical protein